MKESIEIITVRGVRVVDSDYSGLHSDALIASIHRHNAEIAQLILDGERNFRFLTDVTGTIADKEAVQILKETALRHLPYTKKSAAVGVVGVQKILLKAINLFSALETVPFSTRDEAIDWLSRD